MPAERRFFDTNVLLYSLSQDTAKADTADRLLTDGGTISVQVLNELVNVLRRKQSMAWAEIHAVTSILRDLLEVVPIDITVHDRGLALARRYSLSLYDAMIVAAALESRCDILWSEDMQHGLLIANQLTIINPFL